MDRLKNKVAIVFGAGPNIGGTIAHFLAREGASVCVTDIRKRRRPPRPISSADAAGKPSA